MKLSLSWIFDHIDGAARGMDFEELISRFNCTTAEIEDCRYVDFEKSRLFCGVVTTLSAGKVEVEIPELKLNVLLSERDGLVKGGRYLLLDNEGTFEWATSDLFGDGKGHLLPAMNIPQKELAGGWRKLIPDGDRILHVDNKSMTNRPDLWGHRGFAREIAAIMGSKLVPEERLISPCEIVETGKLVGESSDGKLKMKIDDEEGSRRFAGLVCEKVENVPSNLKIAARLASIGCRPINGIVDATNYVMFDTSQPMHAFDYELIEVDSIVIRRAKKGEKLTILDGKELDLSDQDVLVTDKKGAIALAGVMGGLRSSVTPKTRSLFLEAACFSPSAVRSSSIRHKTRTEASSRFEKSLDPNQNTFALMRFIKILKESGVAPVLGSPIISLGEKAERLEVDVKHQFLEDKLGIKLTEANVIKPLESIGFVVAKSGDGYKIKIPTFRSTRDVITKYDIPEEVGRFFGYENIAAEIPLFPMVPGNVGPTVITRRVEDYLAFGAGMTEQRNYSMFDNELLSKLEWVPSDAIGVVNPVSSIRSVLATSRIPLLFGNLVRNYAFSPELRFFELGPVWRQHKVGVERSPVEERRLSGVFFNSDSPVDFYEAKSRLNGMFRLLGLDVSWDKMKGCPPPWFDANQTAAITYEAELLGYAGKASSKMLNRVVDGDAFIFELNFDMLLSLVPGLIRRYKGIPKYPGATRDVSIKIPLSVTAKMAEEIIKRVDLRIVSVDLVDVYRKKEWGAHKSLLFRYVVRSSKGTLSGDTIDQIVANVEKALVAQAGAEIR